MSVQVSLVCDIVLRRVRDLGGVGHPRSFVIPRISDCQRMVNGLLGVVTDSVTFTTTPFQTIYSRSASLVNAVRIVGVRELGRDLARVANLKALAHINRSWFRETGNEFQAWTMVGSDIFILYPAKEAVSSVEVREVRITSQLSGETDLLEIPDESVDLVTELTVAILLLKQRELMLSKDTLRRLMERLGMEKTAERLRITPTPEDPSAIGEAGDPL